MAKKEVDDAGEVKHVVKDGGARLSVYRHCHWGEVLRFTFTACGDADRDSVVADLTQEELKALGVEGDTPQDTLRTLVGRMRTIQNKQVELDRDNKALAEENARLAQGKVVWITASVRRWQRRKKRRNKRPKG